MRVFLAFAIPAIFAACAVYYMRYEIGSAIGTTTVTEIPSTVPKPMPSAKVLPPPIGNPADNTLKFTGSIPAFLAQKGAWRCKLTMLEGRIYGESLSSGGQIKADFDAIMPQVGQVKLHILAGTSTVYSWGGLLDRGVKYEVVDGTITEYPGDETADVFNRDYSFECEKWIARRGIFVLPQNIAF